MKSEYLSSVRAVTGGAAPFGPALIEKFKEKCQPNEVKFREGKFKFQSSDRVVQFIFKICMNIHEIV